MARLGWIRGACIALACGTILAGASTAVSAAPVEELTKRLPDGVVGFVATSGGDALKEDFAKTSLGRIWNDPNVRSFYQAIETQLLAKMQEKSGGPDDMKQVSMALEMIRTVVGRPLVLGVAPLKGPVPKEKPPVYAFAILDAGSHKADFEGLVKKLETLAGAESIVDVSVGSAKMRGLKGTPDLPLYWGWAGDYLVVAANDVEGAALQYLQKPRATAPEYLKKVPAGGDALVIHADLQKAIGIVNAVARQEDAKTANMISAVLKELGLSGVRTFTSRAGFAGSDLVSGSFLEVAGPRTGLLAALKPADPALMDLVDARAVTAGAAHLDVAGAYDAILRAVKAASAETGANVEKGLTALESEAKFSIRKGLLESLAGPVVFYSLGMGTISEAPLGGFVLLLKLKDAELFEKTMTGLGDYAAAQSKGGLQASAQKRDDGRTVHAWMIPQLAMMQVMPTWSVANGYAVIGSNAGVHDTVVKQMAATGEGRKSIRDTAGYKEVAARLPDGVVSLDYADSRTQYTQAMTALQQVWPMAGLFAAQAGFKLPPALPSLGDIIKDMKPSCRSRWIGPDGVYTRYQGPGIEVTLSSVAGISLGMGILMPALARTRELGFRMSSATTLAGLGKACSFYAIDHEDKLPPDLQTLVKEDLVSMRSLESKRKPKGFEGPSYLYVAGQTVSMRPDNVLAYENPEFCADGVNVFFLDSHVQFMKPEAFRRELKATYERLGKEMPEIKFKGETEVKPRAPRPPRPAQA